MIYIALILDTEYPYLLFYNIYKVISVCIDDERVMAFNSILKQTQHDMIELYVCCGFWLFLLTSNTI